MAGVPGDGKLPCRKRLLGAGQQGLQGLMRDSVDVFVGRAETNCGLDQRLVPPRRALDNRELEGAERGVELDLSGDLRLFHRVAFVD